MSFQALHAAVRLDRAKVRLSLPKVLAESFSGEYTLGDPKLPVPNRRRM